MTYILDFIVAMDFMWEMKIFLGRPWLALAPAVIFSAAGTIVRSRVAQSVGIAWSLYCVYEYLMKYRILCSGECNIRVDLVLLFPLLLVLSAAGVVAIALAAFKRFNA